LGEVDDAIAAGQFAASLPNVDRDRVFVAGHSSGAVLTCLAAMLPSPYKAAAAYDGYLDMETWAENSERELVPYDPGDGEEIRVRNPLEFAASLRCPLRLFATPNTREINAALEAEARKAGKQCELVVVGGNHQTMVAPAVQQTITWFRQQSGK
jgi:dienelactone hydrolase